MDLLIVFALLIASGTFSGLTIGLMSLSVDEVMRLADLDDKNAIKVLPVIKKSNQLLVTLLLGNTAVNATLSIFLGGLVGEGVLAGVISTALILIFGEILPAAILTRHALFVGARISGLVKLLMFAFYPIAVPIAFMLDRVLGKEMPTLLSRRELRHVIETHQKSERSDIDSLDRDMILGALSLQEKTASAIMTDRDKVFTIEARDKLTFEFISRLKDSGYTRFPVVKRDKIVGILNIKRLIGIDFDSRKVEVFGNKDKAIEIHANTKADDMLNQMIKRKTHMAVVVDQTGWIGVVTMEDILEELVGQELTDEFGH